MSKTVMFLINSLIPGGAERSLIELLPRLRENAIEPMVVCLYRREPNLEMEVLESGFEVSYIRETGLFGQLRSVRKILRTRKPDLLHTTLFDADIVGRLAALGTEVPVMSTLANTTYDPERLEMDTTVDARKLFFVRAADGFTARHLTKHFHAVSSAVKDSAVRSLSLDPDRVTVVYRGRDPKRLGKNHPERRESARQTFGVDSDAEVFLAVGRQEFQKGYMFLIAAFAEVAVQRPDSVLMLAGREGNATEALKRDVTARGLADRIRFLGHRDDVTDLIVGADVFVFPSLWEGLGGALVEALGLEVPIVASDLPAIREVVVADVNGVLVPPADSRALGEALVRMIADPDERRRLVSTNRSRFESLFGFDSCSDQLIRLIGDVAT